MLKVSNSIYQKCDFISATSPAFLDYLSNVNQVKRERLNVVYQHGEKMFLEVEPYQKQDKLNIVFAGNIGKVQDFDCLVKAVSLLPKDQLNQLVFTIVGSGSYLDEFKNKVNENNLNDVFVFTGRKKVEELIPYYNQASLFLLSLEKGSTVGKTIPSKLQTYMSAGRGIIGSIDGATANIIQEAKAGVTCPAGDYQGLSQIILDMLNQENQIKEFSKNSRDYFLNHFAIEKYVDQIENKMEEI